MLLNPVKTLYLLQLCGKRKQIRSGCRLPRGLLSHDIVCFSVAFSLTSTKAIKSSGEKEKQKTSAR